MINVLIVSTSASLVKLIREGKDFKSQFNTVQVCKTLDEGVQYFQHPVKQFSLCVMSAEVSSSTGENTLNAISKMRATRPDVRIVFLAGEVVPSDAKQAKLLAGLVQNDVYDIIVGSRLTTADLLKHMQKPGHFEDVRYLLQNPAIATESEETAYKNLISIYSVKPGSGKSFVAYNLAYAIAMYGQTKSNGRRPRVALIEGDLSSLSVGSLLHKSNDKYDLVRALKIASQVIDGKGNKVGTNEAIQAAKKEIRKCFIQMPTCKNLYSLSASSMSLADRMAVNPHQYMFVLECVHTAFDVMIADMNSSMEHQTTGPLFAKSGRIYFLVDPDINNIKNNVRYHDDLVAIKVAPKARYVMNKFISQEQQEQFAEDLKYGMSDVSASGIDITATIPYVDPILMNNRTMQGVPLVADKSPAAQPARKALLMLANANWKIDRNLVNGTSTQQTQPKSARKASVKPSAENVQDNSDTKSKNFLNRFLLLLHRLSKGKI